MRGNGSKNLSGGERGLSDKVRVVAGHLCCSGGVLVPEIVVRLLNMVSTSACFMRLGRFLRSCGVGGLRLGKYIRVRTSE